MTVKGLKWFAACTIKLVYNGNPGTKRFFMSQKDVKHFFVLLTAVRDSVENDA